MPHDPRIRASDADRDRVTALLREHHAAGRLTIDEVRERLDRALEASTLGDLDALMTDLPHLDLSARPGGVVARHDAALRIAALAVIVAGYCILGAVFGIWWFPWYLILIAVFTLRTRRPR